MVLAAVAYVLVQVLRPTPEPVVTSALPASSRVPGAPPALPWPASGQAAVGAQGAGVFTQAGTIEPAPIASLAKMMTALVVLKDHPLTATGDAPGVTIDAADVAAYQSDVAQGDSTVEIAAGEQLTERQMLEALLVGSDDNMANVLASWDAGGVAPFVAKMNLEAAALGLRQTHYADASGLDPSTTSTAPDQVVVASAAMSQPAFAAVVATPAVTLPVAGRVPNYNSFVGTDGIVGLKTGNTSAAGGCFAVAGIASVAGMPVVAIGVVMGVQGPDMLRAALLAGKSLIDAERAGLTSVTVVRQGGVGAYLRAPWTGPVAATARSSATFAAWPGSPVRVSFRGARPAGGLPAGTVVGTASVRVGGSARDVTFATRSTLGGPPLSWKLRNA